jgi:hypothetical protein
MANRFEARAAKLQEKGIKSTFDTDLPVDPTQDNEEELDIVANTWKTRPLAGEEPPATQVKPRKKKKHAVSKEEYVTIKIKKTTHQNLDLVKMITGNTIGDTVSSAVETWIQENLTSEQQLLLEQLQTMKK